MCVCARERARVMCAHFVNHKHQGQPTNVLSLQYAVCGNGGEWVTTQQQHHRRGNRCSTKWIVFINLIEKYVAYLPFNVINFFVSFFVFFLFNSPETKWHVGRNGWNCMTWARDRMACLCVWNNWPWLTCVSKSEFDISSTHLITVFRNQIGASNIRC